MTIAMRAIVQRTLLEDYTVIQAAQDTCAPSEEVRKAWRDASRASRADEPRRKYTKRKS